MDAHTFPAENPGRFADALRLFDEANARDPNRQLVNGVDHPRELIYARWLTDWVLRLAPNASEPLRLAARCQHLRRWEIPRETYPMTRAGYLQWRERLKHFHAEKAAEILRQVGYPESVIGRVQELNLKKQIAHDPESQVLEDALCLVFLEHQLEDLSRKTTPQKLLNALQKCWHKMTPAAHTAALAIPFAPEQKHWLEQALKP